MKNEKVIVLLSGGLDSVTLLYHIYHEITKNVVALNISYGQRHIMETICAEHHIAKLRINHHSIDLKQVFNGWPSALTDKKIDVPNIKDVLGHPQPVTYVPNRNMIFLSMAVGYAEATNASRVYYGAQMHDEYGYWDTTPEFVKRINHVGELNRVNRISVEAPFAKNRKSDNIRLGLKLGVDYYYTHSCYDPQLSQNIGMDRYLACGVCPTCSERLKGFEEVGVKDPRPYVKR